MQRDGTTVRANWNDPADRLELIANGMIWLCPPSAQRLAVDDIIAGRAPLNDEVPPGIADLIREQMGETA